MFLCTTVLLHFDTMLSNLVSGASMKSQLNTIDKIIPYSCNITSLLHTFDTVLPNFHFLSFNEESQDTVLSDVHFLTTWITETFSQLTFFFISTRKKTIVKKRPFHY